MAQNHETIAKVAFGLCCLLPTTRTPAQDVVKQDAGPAPIAWSCRIVPPPALVTQGVHVTNTWPGGVVPYRFHSNVSDQNRQRARDAMKEIEKVAGVEFIAHTDEPDWILLMSDTGNYSSVGRIGGAQFLGIFNWGIRFVIVHELMHALGFWHEQQRNDRGDYVQINSGNISDSCDSGCISANFGIQPNTSDNGSYDFDSVMHYVQCAFSKCEDCAAEPADCRTITVLPPHEAWQDDIGQGGTPNHLSVGDIAGLRELYPQTCTLTLGKHVRVVNTNCLGLKVRACAGLNCESIRTAAEGETGHILAGPVNQDGYDWWQIQWDGGGQTGWSAQGEGRTCWLGEVVPPGPCGLTIGQRVAAANTQCLGLRVRNCAEVSCAQIGNRPDGSTGVIVSGPESADDYTWWNIQWDAGGLTGWSAEGDGTACWLRPSTPSGDPGGPCTVPEFSDQFAAGDLNGSVETLAVWDDGNGLGLFAGGSFTVAGGVTANRIAKWDGTSWKPLLVGAENGVNNNVSCFAIWNDGTGEALYMGGSFTTVGGTSASRVAQWKGTAWLPLDTGTSGNVLALAVYDDGFGEALYAGGQFNTAGGINANRIARWDGWMWSPLLVGVNNGVADSVGALIPYHDTLVAGGWFDTAGGISVNSIASWNGATWEPLGAGLSYTPPGCPWCWPEVSVRALAVHDDQLVAGGYFAGNGLEYIARWSGTVWQSLGSGMSGTVYALTAYGADLIAGGGFDRAGVSSANRVARWDGAAWQPLGSGVNGTVYALTTYNADLIAGGGFTTAGGVNAHWIARWNGAEWRALGNGMNNGEVYAQTVYDVDGSGPQPATLYVGGSFTTAGGIAANMIARRDGSAWSAMDSGMSGGSPSTIVHALVGFDPDGGGAAPAYVYAAGNFTSAGGAGASNVARWSGSDWAPLGSGLNGPGFAMVVYDDGGGPDLYIGGSFNNAGGIVANRLVRWDGSSWSKVGNGLNSTVTSLAVFNDGTGSALYVGGNFTNASGVSALRIARWNGSAWSAVGGGMNDEVDALTVWDDGTGPALYASGLFTSAGGATVNRIAKWNGSVWSPVGDGVNGQVLTLSTYNDGFASALYAGGLFTTAGSVTVNRLAKWNGTAWSALGTGMEGIVTGTLAVRSLTVFDEDGSGPGSAGLYIGGNFTTANGVPSGRIARLGCSGPPPCVGVSIVEQPANQTTCSGGAATFSISATGSPTLIYQWRKEGNDIPGAVGAVYTIDPVTPDSAGEYDVVVTNPCGQATSSPATLTVTSHVPADLDADCDVDNDDLLMFNACSTGPAVPYNPASPPSGCDLVAVAGILPADFDADSDVDQDDFAVYQRCFSGEGNSADPDCTD